MVTGGAGYVGAHMLQTLAKANENAVVVDSLITGHRAAVPPTMPFLHADVGDYEKVSAYLREFRVSTIIHFAARISVAESMTNPRAYYADNLKATIALLEAALDGGVKHFILSSTAAVYGNPRTIPIDEDHPTRPINPYGETKLAVERMLEGYARSYNFNFLALRYFNAAGADLESGLCERHDPESHLIPLVIQAAQGRRAAIRVHGHNYPTDDGTCVRDYIHVTDLTRAHLRALYYLRGGGASGAMNLGTGRGYSVKQVIDTASRVTKKPVPTEYGPVREGDPPVLVADPRRAQRALNWNAELSLERIIYDAWKSHEQAN